MKKLTQKASSGLTALSLLLMSSSAQAAGQPTFLANIKSLWCYVMAANGPLVPILAGTAIVAVSVGMLFGEERGGIIGTALKVLFAIGLIVGIGGVLSVFGIDMGCTSASGLGIL